MSWIPSRPNILISNQKLKWKIIIGIALTESSQPLSLKSITLKVRWKWRRQTLKGLEEKEKNWEYKLKDWMMKFSAKIHRSINWTSRFSSLKWKGKISSTNKLVALKMKFLDWKIRYPICREIWSTKKKKSLELSLK